RFDEPVPIKLGLMNLSPSNLNASSPLREQGAVADELQQAQSALRESQERLQAALTAAGTGTFRWDMANNTIDSDLNLERIFGLESTGCTRPIEEFVGVVHPDDRAAVIATIERSGAERVAADVEFRVEWPNGSVHWVDAQATMVLDDDGNPHHLIGTCHDITARKNFEHELRESAKRFEAVFNQAAVGIAVASLDGRLVQVNHKFTDILGYTQTELEQRTFADVTHPDDMEKTLESMKALVEQQLPEYVYEKRYVRKDGSPVWSRTRVAFLRDAMGVVKQFIGVIEDITERKVADAELQALTYRIQAGSEEREKLLISERQARAQAEHMSAMKDEFLATLSHELRTPLSAILGWSQVLRHAPLNENELEKGLDTIERNARIQQQLIEDLLDMSRITSGKLRLNIQPISPVAFVEAAIETILHAASAKGIQLERNFDVFTDPIYGDAHRLQQVVWNVLSNAIKFTPRDGRVEIGVQRKGSHIEIIVSDNGSGIPPEFIKQVFERFRQADSSTTRQQGGLGLGLSIVRHLMELHGGSASIASAGEGKGTTVTLHLPVQAVNQITEDDRTNPATPAKMPFDFRSQDLKGISVLVVDDHPDARELVQRVLLACGATVHTAANADDAVQLVELHRPQVMVSDIGMPDVDGYELIKRVRALGSERGGTLPAIALTAFARSEDRTRALRAGFLVHVSKPVEAAELVATVASVVGRIGQ
ncbi:MAG: PAS domain S-box protein, partial [Gemmatimonadaceae bacterium]